MIFPVTQPINSDLLREQLLSLSLVSFQILKTSPGEVEIIEVQPTEVPAVQAVLAAHNAADETTGQHQAAVWSAQRQTFNDIHIQATAALRNWPSLTLAQKDAILKNLLRWALYQNRVLPEGL